MYVRNGNTFDEIEMLRSIDKDIDSKIDDRFLELEVENYYIEHLDSINPSLEFVKKPRGQQFSTNIGVIDALCKDKATSEYVVIESGSSQ